MKKLVFIISVLFPSSLLAQWNSVAVGTTQDLYAVDYYSSNDIWIGSFNQIVKSTTGGSSWSIINPIKDNLGIDIMPANMNDLALTSPTNAIGTGFYYLGNTECILNTTNAGVNWNFASTNTTVGLPRYINSVDVSGTRAVAVGNNGRIARSINSGVSWTFVSSGVSSLVNDVKFGTYDTVYAAGDNKIFRSVDGGLTWTNQTISGSFKSVGCDRGVVYVGGPGVIYKSIDYGVTYTPIVTPFSYQGTLYAIDKDTVLAAGNDGIYVSRTGGAYWEKYILPSYQLVKMFDFLNSNVGMAVGDMGFALKTNNLSLAPRIPVSLFTIVGGLTTYCLGDAITFSNTSMTAGCTYQWQLNGSTFSTAYTPSTLVLGTEGLQTISLIVTNGYGSDTTLVTVDVLGHSINPIPALVTEDSVCNGNIVGFHVLNSQVGVNYQLRKGFLNIGTVQAGTGGVLYFSSLTPVTVSQTFNIKAVKTTACFTDSLLKSQTIYVYTTTGSPVMICPQAFDVCGSPGFDPGITNVTFGTVNNSTNFIFNNYFDYSCCKNTDVTMGNTYPISVTTAYVWGEFVAVWIDYNNDGVFNATTEVALSGFASPTITGSITIPATTALNQKLRMRVASDIDSLSATNGCSFYCGEIEDYSITILPSITLPVSSFSSAATVGCTTSVAFTNTSYNGTSYSWNFGDGSPVDTSVNPTHVYFVSGTYSVSLITCNPYGCDTITHTETIIIPQLPISSSCVPVLAPMTPFTEVMVLKVDTTYGFGGTLWESLDPNSVNQMCTNQLHLNAASTYYFKCYINLSSYRAVNYWIDYNNDGDFTLNEYINSPLSIGWAYSYGIVPTIVQIPESAVMNTPLRMRVIVFEGPLSVRIDACDSVSGFDGLYHDYTVFIGPALPTIADFSMWGPSPCTNNPVNFLNTSLHANSYLWDYGDGTTDTAMDGWHIYTTPGTYTVKLIASNSLYTDSLIRTNYVTVLPSLPVPSLTLTGTILSTGASASAYKWYKDNVLISGAVSSSYDMGLINGVYKLVIVNSNGCETTSADYPYSPVHAEFIISPTTGCGSTLVFLNNLSINTTSYTIDWGDGVITTPSTGAGYHFYSPGVYTVKYVACNGASCDSMIRTNYITIGTAATVPVISLSGTMLTTASVEPFYQWYRNSVLISGATSSSFTPVLDGDYTLVVTNSSGCSATSAVLYYYPVHPNFFTSTPMYCATSTTSILLINASTNATSYFWDFGDGTTSTTSSPYHSFPPIGTFTVKLIACNGIECDSLTLTNYITTDTTVIAPILVALGDTAICPGNSVDLVANSESGYTYQWTVNGIYLGVSDTLYTVYSTGEYIIEATTPFGCVGSSNPITVNAEACVWPGDADGLGSVDNNDLLPIGLYYGQTGPARASISNTWQAYPASNWGILYPPFSTDIKNADCNGDGVIDDNDTLAVNINYSFVTALIAHPFESRATDPQFYFTSSQSVYSPGDWVDIDLWAGSISQPVNNLYGLAFDLHFDSYLIQPGTGVLLYPNGLMGSTGINTLTFGKIDEPAGYAYGAITRKNHTNVYGSGLIATFRFQIDPTIASFNTMSFYIDDYMANDSAATFVPFAGIPYYAIDVDPMATTISSALSDKTTLSVHPNPYINSTNISYSLQSDTYVKLEVYSAIGQKIETIVDGDQPAGEYKYSFSAKEKGYDAGVYFVKFIVDGKTTMRKIVEVK